MESECSRGETSRLENLAWLVVPSLMAVAVLYLPVLLIQGPILRQDAVNATLPWWTFTRQELLAGRLPLWDPARLGGIPHMANIQAGVLYPPNWLFLPLPPEWAVYLSVVAHIALGGCLMAWFARSLEISPAYAGLAGLVFALSAQVSARVFAGHVQILQPLAWSPLLLLAARQLGATGARRAAGQLAGATALSLLAGYPAVTVYSLGAAGVLFLAGLLQSERRLRATRLLVMAALLTGLMVAPAVWPLLELAGETTRSGTLPMEQAARAPLRPLHAPMLVWPWFFGAAPVQNNWPSPQVWFWHEAQGVGGLMVTLLALAGLWARRRERGFQALGLLALGSVLLALGTRTPAYTLLHELVAPLRSFRIPARFLLVWSLVIPPLAAAGAQTLLERP
ncbi:MAG: hypothetical protein M3P51_15660, partial [Chloroflexota bacterium]|nr:hypothetical protein [Chloroflexota bacterium]